MTFIEYHCGLQPQMIWDGTIDYFKSKGFNTVHLIAVDPIPYGRELKKIQELGMNGILDIEHVRWNTNLPWVNQLPIESFERILRSWLDAGWTVLSSEGGVPGDNDYFQKLSISYCWYNCDECGIWRTRDHIHPNTSLISWETYYPEQIKWIQSGALEAAQLGKQQGILAGVWLVNNQVYVNSLSSIGAQHEEQMATYKGLFDWSYSTGVNFSHFHTWFGLSGDLDYYKSLGFEEIVDELQRYYPPKNSISIDEYLTGKIGKVVNSYENFMWPPGYSVMTRKATNQCQKCLYPYTTEDVIYRFNQESEYLPAEQAFEKQKDQWYELTKVELRDNGEARYLKDGHIYWKEKEGDWQELGKLG